jgi:hypothetical protein
MSFDLLWIVGYTYGGSSGSVLGSTTSNVVNLGVGNDIVVNGHMLLLGKDSIVGLQVIFLEVLSSLGGSDLDIELIVSLAPVDVMIRLTKGLPMERIRGLDIV